VTDVTGSQSVLLRLRSVRNTFRLAAGATLAVDRVPLASPCERGVERSETERGTVFFSVTRGDLLRALTFSPEAFILYHIKGRVKT